MMDTKRIPKVPNDFPNNMAFPTPLTVSSVPFTSSPTSPTSPTSSTSPTLPTLSMSPTLPISPISPISSISPISPTSPTSPISPTSTSNLPSPPLPATSSSSFTFRSAAQFQNYFRKASLPTLPLLPDKGIDFDLDLCEVDTNGAHIKNVSILEEENSPGSNSIDIFGILLEAKTENENEIVKEKENQHILRESEEDDSIYDEVSPNLALLKEKTSSPMPPSFQLPPHSSFLQKLTSVSSLPPAPIPLPNTQFDRCKIAYTNNIENMIRDTKIESKGKSNKGEIKEEEIEEDEEIVEEIPKKSREDSEKKKEKGIEGIGGEESKVDFVGDDEENNVYDEVSTPLNSKKNNIAKSREWDSGNPYQNLKKNRSHLGLIKGGGSDDYSNVLDSQSVKKRNNGSVSRNDRKIVLLKESQVQRSQTLPFDSLSSSPTPARKLSDLNLSLPSLPAHL
eukprot:Awhi_evm1s14493